MKRSRGSSAASNSPDSSPQGPDVADIAGKEATIDKGEEKESPKTPSPSCPGRERRRRRRSSSLQIKAPARGQDPPLVQHLFTDTCPSPRHPDCLCDWPDIPVKFKSVPGKTFELVLPNISFRTVISQLSEDDVSDGPEES